MTKCFGDGPAPPARRLTRRRVLLAAVALTAVVVVVGLVISVPWIRIYTGSAPPDQYYRTLAPPAVPTDRHVLSIAHNAGNNPQTTRRALSYGADVIEIDVTTARSGLVAGRAHGFSWLAERVFRGSTLAQAWRYTAGARITKLDLQRSDRPLLDSLASFLQANAGDRQVMISTRDADAIAYLRPRAPASVSMLFTLAFPDAVQTIQTTPALVDEVAGLSVFQGLVTRTLVSWAHARNLLIIAWTANDAAVLNPLLSMGVDGITTANLAVVEALAA